MDNNQIKKTIIGISALFFLSASVVHAGAEKFDKQMQPILEEYLKIPKALAADKTAGVTKAAKEIEKLASKLDATTVTGEHALHFKGIPAKLQAAAKKLKDAKDIKTMREALKDLSKPMAMWVTMSKPQGVSVAYCSMAPGSWIQKGTKIANPYYGAKMLRCGEIVGGEGKKKTEQHKH
jgi:Cu(I)/Ag(I) efflux system membrane fusion protein